MKIGSIKEDLSLERRIALTPEITKKLVKEGFEVNLQKNYATHLGFEDKEYENPNVKFHAQEEDVVKNSDIITQLNLPKKNLTEKLTEKKILIGVLNPYKNKNELNLLLEKKNKLLFFRTSSKNYSCTIYGCTFFPS